MNEGALLRRSLYGATGHVCRKLQEEKDLNMDNIHIQTDGQI